MKRLLSLAAAAAALAVPMSVSAQGGGDAAFASFQKVCWGTNGDYMASLKAAEDDGWTDTQVVADTSGPVSVTDKAAKSKIIEGSNLTLLVTRGLQHTKGGDVKVDTCKLTISKPDGALIGEGKSWLGGAAPDGGDPTMAVYYVKLAPGSPSHVAQAGLNDALNAGGFVILKFQQDADAGIMVYTAYSK
jgi:hypothetical protein